ncbi:MAG: M28 family peptidase [Bacteroidales bacterium]|nr:M28 family peptidase [Bacteroidales bacterium]
MVKVNLAILLFSLCFIWDANVKAQQIISDSTAQARMYHDVFILTADSLNGREAGKVGERMASDYISKQMIQIGLLPKGEHEGSYLSEFRMNYPVIYKKAKLRVNNIDFKHIEEFGATDLSSPGEVTAPLINIGKGISVFPEESQGENGQSDVSGKIVLMDISGIKDEDNNALLADIISRVTLVVQQGAVGVILHNSSRKTSEDVLFGSPFTESMKVPVVYLARLPFNKIRKIKTGTCTLSVEVDRTVSKPANVVGWIDKKSDKTVVIGAHYDHVGITKSRTGNDKSLQIHNGADDNASGTAALLELARWAVKNGNLKYNYIFAAFSAEEKGLFGSKAFCSHPWVNNNNIVYMLNMDMVGRLGCQGDTISALGVASSVVWNQILDSIKHPGFSIKKINGAPAFSDHAPFLKKGIPVLYFTSGLHPQYHTPQDDIELINFNGMLELEYYLRNFILMAESLPGIPFQKVHTLQNVKAYIQTFK